ncbi:hypothetical protein AURDEDRAFT_176315 [Auricularia subglabra TFB-10046 SS5]|nr:hypothetical protein AURDEDRAFT_176315 [Auricularia subglabra TFB-10046 SS5]
MSNYRPVYQNSNLRGATASPEPAAPQPAYSFSAFQADLERRRAQEVAAANQAAFNKMMKPMKETICLICTEVNGGAEYDCGKAAAWEKHMLEVHGLPFKLEGH